MGRNVRVANNRASRSLSVDTLAAQVLVDNDFLLVIGAKKLLKLTVLIVKQKGIASSR